MMAELPMIMNSPMVLAILAGRKTVTRRSDMRWARSKPGDVIWVKESWRTAKDLDGLSPVAIGVKAVDAGYRLPWAPIEYVADGKRNGNWSAWDVKEAGRTRVSIHMCRWMSRIAMPIVSVRVENLQDITDEDAAAEGLRCLSKDGGRTWKWGIPDRDGWPGACDIGWEWTDWNVSPRAAYARLWELINPERPWASNPAVVRVEFAPEGRS